VLDGPSFIELLAEQDVRVFGFLMGNSANWPLMQLVTDVSGGFYTPVSNMDDIAGQIARARAQMSHEALHGFTVTVDGAGASGLAAVPRTATHGDQIVAFGKYAGSGSTRVTVTARVGGVPASYEATVTLPEVDERFPELERLWALAKVEELELAYSVDLLDRELARADVEQIGVEYQIVTDETSMILLTEEALRRYGIDPRNRERSLTEEEARAARDEGEPVGTSSGDGSSGASTGYGGTSSGGYSGSGSDSWGGGAIGTVDALALAGGAAFLLLLSARRRRRRR
jgi:Ca-activated chloride channel family protein